MRYSHKYVNFLLDGSEYYDFELAAESTSMYGGSLYDDAAVIDINVCSGFTSTIRWTGATMSTFDLNYITTTGLDNYFVDVPHAYSGGTIDTSIVAHYTDDEYFEFHPVSGWTTQLSYDIINTTCLAKLNGGFYQGFFKLYQYPYELMPARMRKGWTVDMIVKFPVGKIGTGTTLNDIFPNNEGFIFYFGTRAEDKYWNGFTTGTPSETSVLFNWTGLTITDPRYQTYFYPSYGAGMSHGVDIYYYNPDDHAGISEYLYYHTSNKGYGMIPTANDSPSLNPLNPSVNDGNIYGGFKIGYAYGGGTSMTMTSDEAFNGYSPLYTHGDEFITSGGTSYEGYYHYDDHKPYGERYYGNNSVPLFPKYPFKSITDNAFGIRIRPDGHIGYRVLRIGNVCQTGTTITVENGITGTTTPTYKLEEGYSPFPIWTANNNGYVNITITFERYIELNDCELNGKTEQKYRMGTLTIFVNARPVLRVDNFEEIIPHELDRQKELQNGVPFNISWGGGTQGLLESVTFGGIDAADRNLMLQQLFAGTWMGSLQSFKMYIRPLYVPQIIHNFELRKAQYNMQGDFGGRYIFITKG